MAFGLNTKISWVVTAESRCGVPLRFSSTTDPSSLQDESLSIPCLLPSQKQEERRATCLMALGLLSSDWMESNLYPPAFSPEKPSQFPLAKLKPSSKPKLNDIKLSHILNGETCPPIGFSDFASYLAKKEMTLENLLFVLWYRSYAYRWNELGDQTRGVPRPSTKLGDRHDPFNTSTSSGSSSSADRISQPMRDEAQRAYTTFFQSGGSRELNCSDELRQFAATCLKQSTGPEVVSASAERC